MKIGIITYWNSNDNYGQQLQCYALQAFLKSIGHSPYLIRFNRSNTSTNNLLRYLKNLMRYVLIYPAVKNYINKKKNYSIIELKRAIENRNIARRFPEFRNEYLEMSAIEYHSLAELKKKPPLADVYITGSDQVWSQLLNISDNKAYFLDFGHPLTKRVAYAPSFSMMSYPKELWSVLSRQLSHFDAISVRENSGIQICKSVGFNATKVLDPTLLLEAKDYSTLTSNKSTGERFIFFYSINIKSKEDVNWKQIKKYADKHNLRIKVTPASGYCLGEELFEDVDYDYATISQWLSNIKNCKFVITPSFHGIVYSIIFHKPFVYIPLKGGWSKGNNRILDLLEDLHLQDNIMSADNTIDNIISRDINWEDVDRFLNTKRIQSVNYIKKSLK